MRCIKIMRLGLGLGLGLAAAALLGGAALAQTGSIYTCTDAQGRKLTSDRLIMACLDREQRELSPGGVLRRVIAPSLSTEERLRAQERARTEAQARARATDERRQQQALLMRYGDPAAHQRERTQALRPVQAMLEAAERRQQELGQQHQAVTDELAQLQRADPAAAAPARLLQRKADIEQQMVSQEGLVRGHQRELERIEGRFDTELERLQRLWVERDTQGPAR